MRLNRAVEYLEAFELTQVSKGEGTVLTQFPMRDRFTLFN